MQPQEISSLNHQLSSFGHDYFVTNSKHGYNRVTVADCSILLDDSGSFSSRVLESSLRVDLWAVDNVDTCCGSSSDDSFLIFKGTNDMAYSHFYNFVGPDYDFNIRHEDYSKLYLHTTTAEALEKILPDLKELIAYCHSPQRVKYYPE
jgi:hypothetical protein